MVVIHLATSKGVSIAGYESEIIPRVGEIIKMPRDGEEYEVLKVTHMLNEQGHGLRQDLKLEIIHCAVLKVRVS